MKGIATSKLLSTKLIHKKSVSKQSNFFESYDIKHIVLEKLRNFNIFQKDNPDSNDNNVQLNPAVEKTFKQICYDSKGDQDLSLKNQRLTKAKMKKFLQQKYDARLAVKLTAIFGWQN